MSNLSKLLARSNTLAQQGDLAGARAELEKAVRDQPRRAEPWISLAAVHGMSGNYPESLRCARKAVELAPDSLQSWANLAFAARATGDFALAADALQRASRLPGCPPQIIHELGMTLARLERWAEAERPLREHFSRNPRDRQAALALARVLAKIGNIDGSAAVIGELRQRNPQDVDAIVQIGRIYCEAGRNQDAWNCCEQLVRDNPDNPEALFFKVELMEFEGRLNEAVDLLDQLGRMCPNDARVFAYLAAVSHELGNPDDAIAYARAALARKPGNVATILQLSSLLITRDVVEARQLLERAETLAPANLTVIALKGQILEFEGDKQGAWDCARSVIHAGSIDSVAAAIAARVAPALGKADETIALLEQIISRPGLSTSTLRMLRFALAQLCDKAKHYDRAFEHAVVANQLKGVWYDHNGRQTKINRLKTVYTKETIATLPHSTNRSELPIFIVGMPRSGTSLLEQILSCHSKVHARGETNDVRTLSEGVPYYPDGMRNLSQEKCDALAAAYVQRLHAMAPDALHVTDKMPGNYAHLGLISQILPGARIINCRRDPRDICLSNFMIDFLHSTAYAYSLESLALTYKDYLEVMAHWKSVLDLPILDVRYEDLIDDPRTWVAKTLEFCGLEWEDACLNFHQAARQVMTASYDQVRKPLYKSSVARWKHYERQLAPVSELLGLRDDSYP